MDYRKKPQYQLAMQRLRAMTPGQQAVFQAHGLEEAFADREMKKGLMLKRLGFQEGMAKKKLAESKRQFDVTQAEGQRRFDISMGLRRSAFDFERDQVDKASVLGKFNMVLALGSGLLQWQENRKTRRMLEDLASIYRNK